MTSSARKSSRYIMIWINKLAYLPVIRKDSRGPDYDNLNQLLIRFSDVFYSDINLYDPKGNLLATSRSEIFDQGMQGEKMNPVAYEKMVMEKQAEFIHREKIGKPHLSFCLCTLCKCEWRTYGLS